ncbi:MAG: hypothetical protein ACK4WH_06985 [Phycisphaerales bacterium]
MKSSNSGFQPTTDRVFVHDSRITSLGTESNSPPGFTSVRSVTVTVCGTTPSKSLLMNQIRTWSSLWSALGMNRAATDCPGKTSNPLIPKIPPNGVSVWKTTSELAGPANAAAAHAAKPS